MPGEGRVIQTYTQYKYISLLLSPGNRSIQYPARLTFDHLLLCLASPRRLHAHGSPLVVPFSQPFGPFYCPFAVPTHFFVVPSIAPWRSFECSPCFFLDDFTLCYRALRFLTCLPVLYFIPCCLFASFSPLPLLHLLSIILPLCPSVCQNFIIISRWTFHLITCSPRHTCCPPVGFHSSP